MATVKATIQTVRAMGLTCRVTELGSQSREYRINYPQGTEDSAYYTENSEDAIMTAASMVSLGLVKKANAH